MNTLTKILVGLDLSELDETLIQYAAFLCSQSAIEEVVFVHAEKNMDIPPEVIEGMPPMQSPEESLELVIEQKVEQYFKQVPGVQVRVHVVEGSPANLLKLSKEAEVNLMLLGRKLRLKGSGDLSQKLLRSGKVSIMFIPENTVPRLQRVVVSVDFSEYSMMALERLLQSALVVPAMEIVCLHAYEVPTGYITLGESYQKFDERMKGFASTKFEQVLERFPELKSRASLKLVRQENDDDIGELIVMEAKRAQADMLVVGAKGKTAAAVFMLGSVTGKILRHNHDIPLLVFKNPAERVGLMDVLLGSSE
ncbi:universal stress protein [Pontibacter harenae]|uniref:universal stress protein n=1 Tax=Pontibacter harenae TaxID=2894083 RepID=UPI001E3D2B27|nr:universal stress protein [Pontibacter harenae]MCC9167111.1 universal stress protein [Pontibacter harenae]